MAAPAAAAERQASGGLLVLGMAGSLSRGSQDTEALQLDPAVHEVPFPANIDIGGTVKSKEVMKQYDSGPTVAQ